MRLECVATLKGHSMNSVAFSPDGGRTIRRCGCGTRRPGNALRDAATGEGVAALEGHSVALARTSCELGGVQPGRWEPHSHSVRSVVVLG